ncbi:MAG: amidohydrolase [Nitriliruptoraceae bacterium]
MPRTSDELAALYRDLHQHPELGFAETRTAALAADHLETARYEVHRGIGRTGVAGVLRRGPGPTVLLRADMDALPVREETGLPYASTVTATVDGDGPPVPVMHACGHDVHVTCLLGAADRLAADASWSGTLVVVLQPAEELGAGARAMVDDGLYDRVPRPDVVLGQHVAPLPAGVLGLRGGVAFAASDTLTVTLHGQGAHASRPENAVDPIVLAAAVVLRLQTIVARELPATEPAVVTVGSLHAGTVPNVIPDRATLGLSVRTFDPGVRARVLAAIERIVRGEAAAAGAPPPEVTHTSSFPAVVNDPAAVERTAAALGRLPVHLVDPGLVTGSEDVGLLAAAAEAPCCYWLLGGADPAAFAEVTGDRELAERVAELPGNHSPSFAPVVEPTLTLGVEALVVAAQAWLASSPVAGGADGTPG